MGWYKRPAPAVIPAPIVYFKIVAVKTFVVVPRGAYLGSMAFHCYAWPCLGWSVAVTTSLAVWTKERSSTVPTFSECNVFGRLQKEMLLEWAHDVHLDPSSELFLGVSWLAQGRSCFGSIRLRSGVSECECRWFGHWPNCEQIKVFKTGNVFLVMRQRCHPCFNAIAWNWNGASLVSDQCWREKWEVG